MDKGWRKFITIFQGKNSPEAKQFLILVSSCHTDQDILQCFDYFVANFTDIDFNTEIDSSNLEDAIISYAKPFLSYFTANFDDFSDKTNGFKILSLYLSIGKIDKEMVKSVFDFSFNILKKDPPIIQGSPFLEKVFQNKILSPFFFLPANLPDLFVATFTKSKKEFVETILNSLQAINFNSKDSFLPFYDSVVKSFEGNLIVDPYNALKFIGIFLQKISDDNFIEKLFQVSQKYWISLSSLDIFIYYFQLSNDIEYKFFNTIVTDCNINSDLFNSAIISLNEANPTKEQLNLINFENFLKHFSCLDTSQQNILFEMIYQIDEDHQIDLMKLITPPWLYKISGNYYLTLLNKISVARFNEICVFLIDTFEKVDDDTLLNEIDQDSDFSEAIFIIVSNIRSNMITKITYRLLRLLSKKESCEPILKCLKQLFEMSKVEYITIPVIDFLKQHNLEPHVSSLFCQLAQDRDDFVSLFLQDGIEVLFQHLNTIEAVDFLASVVCNGPYSKIDSLVLKYYDQSILNTLDSDQLKKLAFGISHDNDSFGLLRIPSLIQFCKGKLTLMTPFDKYVYGKICTQYSPLSMPPSSTILTSNQILASNSFLMKSSSALTSNSILNPSGHASSSNSNIVLNTDSEIDLDAFSRSDTSIPMNFHENEKLVEFDKNTMQFIRQYIRNGHGISKKLLFNDAKCVYHMVKGKTTFSDIYEMHFDMPHAIAETALYPTFGFWFFVKHIIGKTVILKTGNLEIAYDCDGLHVFDKDPVECTLKNWHFLVLVSQSKNYQLTNYVTIYLDGMKLFENFVQISETVVLGSEKENRAIWYINSNFLISNTSYAANDIQSLCNNSVHYKNSLVYTKVNLKTKGGFRFVKYRGIGRFLSQLGNPEFVFLKMLSDNNDENTFYLWMKSAFLLKKKCKIDNDFFNESLKYCILRKREFFSDDCQQFFLKNFDQTSFNSVFGDLQIISIPTINFDFLSTLFSLNFNFDELFGRLLDAYCILELNNETMANIEDSLFLYLNKHPYLIERVIMTAAALHNFEDDDPYETSKPSKNSSKIDKLLNLAIRDSQLYTSTINFWDSLNFLTVLPDFFCSQFLKKLTVISTQFNNYTDSKSLKHFAPFLISLFRDDSMWIFLLTLLTGHIHQTIDEFITEKDYDIEILKIILYIIATTTSIEMREFNSDNESINSTENSIHETFNTSNNQSTGEINSPKRSTIEYHEIDSQNEIESSKELTIDNQNEIDNQSLENSNENSLIDNLENSNENIDNSFDSNTESDFNIPIDDKNNSSLLIDQALSNDNEKDDQTHKKHADFDHYFISFRVFLLLKEICGIDGFLKCPEQIERLCSLGFDKLSYQPLPIEDNNDEREQPSFMISIDVEKTSMLSPDLQQATHRYLTRLANNETRNNAELSASNSRKMNVLQAKLPETIPDEIDLDELFNSKSVLLIIDLISQMLVTTCRSSFTNYRKTFTRYTVFASDVHQTIVRMMHTTISLHLIETTGETLSGDAMNAFFRFLMQRILEKLWTTKQIVRLIKSSTKILNNKMKNFKQLAFISMSKLKTTEDKIDCFCCLFSCDPFCDLLIEDNKFFNSFLHLFCIPEFPNSKLYPQLYDVIVHQPKLINHEFGKAVLEKRQLIWYASKTDSYKEYFMDIIRAMDQVSLGLTQIRNGLVIEPQCPNYIETQRIRNEKNLIIRRSFRFQLFYKVNIANFEFEDAIIRLFRREKQISFILHPPDQFMTVRAPQPMTIPQKMDPLVYSFIVPFKKTTHTIPLLRSTHHPMFTSTIKELNEEKKAAFCLSNWPLPPFSSSHSVFEVLEDLWKTDSIINCDFLSTPELLPCVCSIGNDSLKILMNSKIENERIILPESSVMLCHFEAFELFAHGFFGNQNTSLKATMIFNRTELTLSYDEVKLVIERKYAFQPRMVDIFTRGGFHLTVIFDSIQNRKKFISKVRSKNRSVYPSLAYSNGMEYGIGYSEKLLMDSSLDEVKNMWISGHMSTLDYLLYINIESGRSFNDPSQYPIFPWILGDFEENEPVRERDLTKPMGAQTQNRCKRFIQTYEETNYHYGTHYSHSAAVLHYMVRIEPYTFFSIHLHNGWDHKDRLFCNVAEAWRSASETNQADVKELIPEFYSFPNIFENVNHLELGHRTDGLQLNSVTMPKWGKDTLKFIWHMRIALENSENINDWIDLIFGYKQRGEEAVKATNCFQPMSYDDALKTEYLTQVDMSAAVDMINNFGQCPAQLFKEPHPKRKTNPSINHLTLSTTTYPKLVTKLISTSKYPKIVRVIDSQIYVASNNELFVGFPPSAIQLKNSKEKSEIKLRQRRRMVHHQTSLMSVTFSLLSQNALENSENESSKLFDNEDNNEITQTSEVVCDDQKERKKSFCYCLSSDSNMFCYASKFGMVTVKDSMENIVTKFISSLDNPTSIAFSSQHFLIIIADSKTLHMFDATTGFFIRKTPTFTDDIIQILFDDVSNLIIAAEKTKITVLGLDFRVVASESLHKPKSPSDVTKYRRKSKVKQNETEIDFTESELNSSEFNEINTNAYITALAVCDSEIWCEEPFFLVGRSDGLCEMWTLKVLDGVLTRTNFVKIDTAVASIRIFADNQAALVFGVDGDLTLVSIFNVCQCLVNKQYFMKCAVCRKSEGSFSRCKYCGLYVCKNCRAKRMPVICSRCKQLGVLEETSSASKKLSESGTE